jgi:hypothetical protein
MASRARTQKMFSITALARKVWRTFVQSAAVLSAVAIAGQALASPILAVGDREVIYSTSQRRNLGLNFWPDGNMGVAAAGNGQIHFYAANSSSSVRTTGTLASPGTSKQNVNIYGSSGYNYLAGGPIYQDPATGTRLMVYHAEVHGGSQQQYYTTLGLAVATDPSGLNFQDLGAILRPNLPQTLSTSIDIGGGSITAFNGDLYIHYRDFMADGSVNQLAVARAPLSQVISNAMGRQSTQFTKYYNGAWSQPGLGGLSSYLETGNRNNGWTSVTYNDYLNQFVMATTESYGTDRGDLYFVGSVDGVNWGPRVPIALDWGEQFYPSLVGTGPDPARTGQSFYVYYTDSQAGMWNRWSDAQLVRRQITFDPAVVAPPSGPAPTANWTSVGSFAGDYQSGAPAAGWKYLWAATGKTGNASTYQPLKWSSTVGAYNTTGGATQVWSGGKGHVDDYLSLGAAGGHPGQPNYNIISAYTIQPDDGAGLYRIANSSIVKADSTVSAGEDGLSLAVYVNNALIGNSLTVPTSGALLNFDRELGQLAIGDTIYVALGAGANQNYDSFKNFDFAIQRYSVGSIVTPPPTPPLNGPVVTPPVVAPPAPQMTWVAMSGFQSDFRAGVPAAGWNYQWTISGKSGNAAAYASLKWSDMVGAYNTTGGATPVWSGGKGHVDDYLSLGAGGGHPGQSNYNIIASYTIQGDDGAGLYRIANSFIMKGDATISAGEDGLSLAVYVNNVLKGSSLTVPTSGLLINFDRELGQLAVGDTVYVIIGAGANQNYDSFKNFDFTLQKYVQVAALATFAAVPEPATGAHALVLGAAALGRRRRRAA